MNATPLFISACCAEQTRAVISPPYLCVSGEWDKLSPMVHTKRMLKTMSNPRRLVVYQEARHSIGARPSVNLGPYPPPMVVDWMAQPSHGAGADKVIW